MRPELGQVWRRPDGTLWAVIGEPYKQDVCMRQLMFNRAPSEISFVSARWEMFPMLVISETWMLAHDRTDEWTRDHDRTDETIHANTTR